MCFKKPNQQIEIFATIQCRSLYFGFLLSQNEEAKIYNKDREKFLKSLDINIIRFWNDEVLNDLVETLNKLQNKIKQLSDKQQSPPP